MNGDSNEAFAAASEDFDAPRPDRDASDDPAVERRLIALIRERVG
jgi:hypothetical protein